MRIARKPLILKTRRDVRVVEGARLESVCRGNSTVGSNPTLSARSFKSQVNIDGSLLCATRSPDLPSPQMVLGGLGGGFSERATGHVPPSRTLRGRCVGQWAADG